MFGRGGGAITGAERRDRSSSVVGLLEAAADLAGQLRSAVSLSHFARLLGCLGEQRVEVDRRRGAVASSGLDGDRRARRPLQAEAHHRLVDRADLLDVEGAVGEPLAVEDEQVVEHAEDVAVGHERRLDPLVRPGARQPRCGLRGTGSGRGRTGSRARRAVATSPCFGPVVDQPEQRQQLRPGAVALVHRVGVARGVLAQPLEQAGDRVVADGTSPRRAAARGPRRRAGTPAA